MLKKILFSLTAVIIFFLLAEGVCRIIYPFWYKQFAKDLMEKEMAFYRNDPVLGWTLTPNYEGYRETYGKKHYYRTNSLGLRDKEYPFEKEKGTYRIICVGDSITEGVAADNDNSYPKLLEKIFRDSGAKSVEVINAGIVDYCSEQEYILLKERALKYNPDMVILGYFLNDARGFIPSKTIYARGMEGVLNKSKFLYLLDQMIMKYRVKAQYKKWEKDRHNFWQPYYDTSDWRRSKDARYKLIEISKKDWGLAWTDRGWETTKYYLDKFMELGRQHNFKFAVVAFPITVQLYADDSDTYMYLPQARLKEYCRRNNIVFIDPLPFFKKLDEKKVFIDACHYSEFGLDYIAGLIYQAINKDVPR